MSDTAFTQSNDSPGDKRERSSIEFPYMSLEEAMNVAKAVHATTGSGVCHADQLAAAMNLSMASSGFRVRLSTAKMFGLIESERGSGGVRLTDLGHKIVDGDQERAAKVEAFLNVPLYKQLVDMHRGKPLPPPPALERMMAELGVAKKQTDRARQTFDRSAQSAGFFEFGRDKLVMPAVAGAVSTAGPATPPEVPAREVPAIVHDSVGTGDPLIDALIKKLPAVGKQWPASDRKTWLTMISMAFDLAYGAASESKTAASETVEDLLA